MFRSTTSMGILWSGFLDKGESVTLWFWPFADKASGNLQSEPSIWARPVGAYFNWSPQYWFTITPINPPGFRHLVPYDQHVGISSVSWILKGENHELDGTGGAADLLLEITIQNFSPAAPVNFDLWMHRADYDMQAR